MKVKFNLSVPVAWYEYFGFKEYERDAKRIMKKQAWNSRKYQYDDGRYIVDISHKNGLISYWVVEMIKNKTTDETRVTPLGQMEHNGPPLVPFQYYNYKLK